jgi:UPF0755 protein
MKVWPTWFKRKKRRKKSRFYVFRLTSRAFCGFILLFFLLSCGLACWWVNSQLLPTGSSSYQPKEIFIPYNSSTAEIAAILQREGLIKNSLFFRLYARYRGCHAKFQAGEYLFSRKLSLNEIMDALQRGVVLKKGFRFTIPEGFTVEQTALQLAREGLVQEEEFLRECLRPRRGSSFQFLGAVPPGVRYTLEGYLFPDTYEIEQTAVMPAEITALMLQRFHEIFAAEFYQRAAELGFSTHEIVTLASLVEREARVPEERPLIAAVFHNRLRSENMPYLQSCATVQYVLGEVKPVLTYAELAVDSPYNTYLYPGLPPGPIASPGQEALKAALYPADVDYLYFVYKEDGSGTHYFSTTLDEHDRYKEIARQNRENRKNR